MRGFHAGCAGDDPRFFMSRHGHRHGRGFRHLAGVFGGEGFGPFDFRAGRKLAAGDLQLVLLALLEVEPRHGYELIKELEKRSGGFYVPSAGMIYPALTLLEELEYARVEVAGAKKLYHITQAGTAHLNENREAADAMLQQLEFIGGKMDWMRGKFRDAPFEDDGRHAEGPVHELWRARHDLRDAIRGRRGKGNEEAMRIAEILKRAIVEIREG